MMDQPVNWIRVLITDLGEALDSWFQISLLESVVQIALVLLAAWITVFVSKKIHPRLIQFPQYAEWHGRHRRLIESVFVTVVGVLVLMKIWHMHWGLILALWGAFLLSLGLAFQEILINLIAYPVVRLSLAVQIGDDIQIVGLRGKLTQRRWTHLLLAGSFGEIITVPNRKVLTDILSHSKNTQTVYHFEIEFPVSLEYQSDLSHLLEFCYEMVLLSAYRSLDNPPEVSADLHKGQIWLRCVCYTNRQYYIAPYRTFILKELAEKTNVFSTQPRGPSKEEATPQSLIKTPFKLKKAWGKDVNSIHPTTTEVYAEEGKSFFDEEATADDSTIEMFDDESSAKATAAQETSSSKKQVLTQDEVNQMNVDQLNELIMSGEEHLITMASRAITQLSTLTPSTEKLSAAPLTEASTPSTPEIPGLTQEAVNRMDIDQLNELVISGDEDLVAMAMKAMEQLVLLETADSVEDPASAVQPVIENLGSEDVLEEEQTEEQKTEALSHSEESEIQTKGTLPEHQLIDDDDEILTIHPPESGEKEVSEQESSQKEHDDLIQEALLEALIALKQLPGLPEADAPEVIHLAEVIEKASEVLPANTPLVLEAMQFLMEKIYE
ncbi:mechanosensitive ion channel family protein [Deltaproteobacteria bacterium TL4]